MSTLVDNLKQEMHDIARSLSIKMFDVFGTTKEENSASSKHKKPFQLSSSFKTSVLIRVWNEKKQVGVTRTSDLSPNGIKQAFELARDSAEFSSKEKTYDFSEESFKETFIAEQKMDELATIHKMSSIVVESETKILESEPYFKSVPYNKISESLSTRFYMNSQGAFRLQKNQSSFCYFYPLAELSGGKPRQAGHTEIAQSFLKLDVNKCLNKSIEKTKSHLKYKNIENGKYTCIFAPEAFLDLLYAFGNFMNAQNVLDKKSLFNESTLGTLIASDIFNLYDSPQHELNSFPIYFDEEGTPTQETTIVADGVFKSFLHSSYTAKIFKSKTTGHGQIGAKVTVSPYFLRVARGKALTANRNILTEKNAIYIEQVKALHSGINAMQGSFSLPFDGFHIQDGQMTSLESATVAGDFLSLMKDIFYLNENEECVSNGISPYVWVQNLSVTSG